MNDGNSKQLSRGDVARNDRRKRLRAVVAADRAVTAIDLADKVQEIVVVDHDGIVKARRNVICRAWELTPMLVWAREQARAAGFDDTVVACEPTGYRWKAVAEQCDQLGLDLVCVQPMLVHREREREDLTRDRSDSRDAVLIADLTIQLRCYVPERTDVAYARLRHLGACRQQLVTRAGAARQQVRDLLACAWPAVLDAAAKPLDSATWKAALAVVCNRIDNGGDLGGLYRGWRRDRYANAVRRAVVDRGGQRVCWRIAYAVWDTLADPTGVATQRPGVIERVGLTLPDWDHTLALQADVQSRMVAVLDSLDLTGLVTSIDGLSAVGAATILAETGDLDRFVSGRAVVKHAGLCPRANASGNFQGDTRTSGRGRPALRLAAWRAVWGALGVNDVLTARYHHLTTRNRNKLTAGQARAAVAASLLRQLHAVVTKRQSWNPTIAAGNHAPQEVMLQAA